MRLPRRPADLGTLIRDLSSEDVSRVFGSVRSATHDGKYIHWDQLRHRAAPPGLTHEEWWFGLKWNRRPLCRDVPLEDVQGNVFSFAVPESAQRLLHEITQRAGGSVGAPDLVTNPDTRNRYLVRNLMEEGITSSLIEGASTTRVQAKEMLRSEREPRSQGEQMVLNNYRAMQHIIAQDRAPLTPETVYELHEIITRDTLDDPSAAGRLRRSDEQIDVIDVWDNEVLHTPPPADQLPERLVAMCRFANGETPDGFVHPVVRSILLHFWLAYDHPFTDGNGRCARALFYWSMLKHDYWLCQFISISDIILNAPAKYARAFLLTETDANDLTYFLLHQLDVAKRAIDKLYDYLDETVKQRVELERRLKLGLVLNDRQLDVVGHALRHPDARYGIKQHGTKFGVVYQTARTDLLGLADMGVLIKAKTGRTLYFMPEIDLEAALKAFQTSA